MNDKDAKWLLSEKYNGEPCTAYYDDLARLEAGEPLAYVIGHVPFLGCTIWLDSHPLIPRAETEFWVEKAIEVIRTTTPEEIPFVYASNYYYVLDLCAGSGCIGTAVASTLPACTEVHFAEINQSHHSTIRKNMQANGVDDTRIPVFGGDLFEQIGSSPYKGFRYHFILANPPYIDPALDRSERSVREHEPHEALYGGVAGTELIERIIAEAPAHLHPHGQLWIEHEPEQEALIKSLGTKTSFSVSTHPDQYSTQRYSILVLQ